jgi:hypothetical protein
MVLFFHNITQGILAQKPGFVNFLISGEPLSPTKKEAG